MINGPSVAQAIGDHGLLPEGRTAQIGLRVLDALHVAHRAGITHRDVKPANILLGADQVVLTDFGIAAIDDGTALTATGIMVGSPASWVATSCRARCSPGTSPFPIISWL